VKAPQLSLAEVRPDVRSRQVTVSLSVRNPDEQPPLKLVAIHQIGPRRVRFEAPRNISQLAQLSDSGERCRRAERAFTDYLLATDPRFGFTSSHPAGDPTGDADSTADQDAALSRRWRSAREGAREIAKNVTFIVGTIGAALTFGAGTGLARRYRAGKSRRRAARQVPRFETVQQAEQYGRNLLDQWQGHDDGPARLYCRTVVDQLGAVKDPTSQRLDYEALVAPGARYVRPFVVTCGRGWFAWRKYTIALQVFYERVPDEGAGTADPTGSSAAGTAVPLQAETIARTLTISPQPLAVTVVAACAGALGALLHYSPGPPSSPHAWTAPFVILRTDLGAIAVILAALLFNVFEYTSLAGRFARWVDWRGALMVGLVAGLSSGPVLAELERVLPASTSDGSPAACSTSGSPGASPSPSAVPSPSPSAVPSPSPSAVPSPSPSAVPTALPTALPTGSPNAVPAGNTG
jgi:hypothetical protein